MDPDGGGRSWECVAESGLVPHSLPGAQVFSAEPGKATIKKSVILSAKRKGWAGLKSYQEK